VLKRGGNKLNFINGNIVSPKGFQATGGFAGIKKQKNDLCLVYSSVPCKAAGMFTTNIVKAAPVLWDQELVNKGGAIHGLVVNSGNANACTGKQGIEDNRLMAEAFAAQINAKPEEVLICSTGVIGQPMPMDAVQKGIREISSGLGSSYEDGILAAEAIMTTDTFMKAYAVQIELDGKTVALGGMAKGSGMIHPNMATMLSFVTTDVNITKELLQKALRDTVEDTYHMISVDDDTSTNDTVLVLANGCAENPLISAEDERYHKFVKALGEINRKLAVDIARDGEGASKLIEATVTGAVSKKDAVKLAKSIISSSLFKAAMFGADANWGRALCAMGYSGGSFDPDKVSIAFRSGEKEILLMDVGNPVIFDEELALEILKNTHIYVDILLRDGDATATAWGCDLTYDYVKINGEYRS